MQRQGLHPDVVTYTVLVSSSEACRMTERALQLSDELQRQGLHPDVVTYTVLISTRRKCRMIERALQPYDGMQQQDSNPNLAGNQPVEAVDTAVATCLESRIAWLVKSQTVWAVWGSRLSKLDVCTSRTIQAAP